MSYTEEKHKQLNEFAQAMRLKTHDAQVKEYEILSKEIEILEERIKWARFIFIIIFAFGMMAGIIGTTVLTFLDPGNYATDAMPAMGAGTAFAPELALYQAITNPMQGKANDLDKRRRDISMSWIKDKENIARRLSDESKTLTEFITDIKDQ